MLIMMFSAVEWTSHSLVQNIGSQIPGQQTITAQQPLDSANRVWRLSAARPLVDGISPKYNFHSVFRQHAEQGKDSRFFYR
jgi:hypothetical protein